MQSIYQKPIDMNKISIIIVDDHKLIRQTWAYFLNADRRFMVVAEAGSSEEALVLFSQHQPDVVILDINLPGMSGLDAIPLIKENSPNSKILGVSMHTQPAYAKKMMQKGASGYVTKTSTTGEMFKAIEAVVNNKTYICEEIKNSITDQAMSDEDATHGIHSLSGREIEVIQHIKSGASSKEIAHALFISIKTVEVHRYNILRKLSLKNSASLVNFINSQAL
jgi:DNA-binding NarL/FixJ family response regulator